ncbi:MAG: T9SS type A sorting domain-containing protein [ANME-2 cluster archaeon]|nr:MAG: T9SS type A sorting domain-containing protein [ANME-2 cluster archaeon]
MRITNMKSIQPYLLILFVLIFILGSSNLLGQVNMTVNSLADDEYAYPYDNPDTEFDESRDGVCNDEMGRCTLRAAIEESNMMEVPVHLTFGVSGTINLNDNLYPEDGSVIQGGGNIELTGLKIFEIDNKCTIGGIKFDNFFNAITVTGNHNIIGISNVFLNSYIALVIEGDSNSVVENRFGIDENNVLGPNSIGILITGNNTYVSQNTICGNMTGISLAEGGYNDIKHNFIGTTAEGDSGLGNIQGIVFGGSGLNLVGGQYSNEGNVISGNDAAGIMVTGVPPDDYSIDNRIWNNIIGLDPTESRAIPNGNGIVITNGARYEEAQQNIIAGNSLNGIYIFGYDEETMSHHHIISDNLIGINSDGVKFPNGFNGISIWGNVEEVIIGTNIAGNHLPNRIVGNQGTGIWVSNQFGYSPSKITARKNLIYQNDSANLLIAAQCNEGINPPYSLSFSNNTIAGIHQFPNVIIDIYKSDINEFAASAYQWLGSTTTSANGVFSYEITDPVIEAVSLTATTSSGNTSGFAYLELITGVREATEKIPTEFSLGQNYPNPFNPITTIEYSLPKAGPVTLTVYNNLGEHVKTLINQEIPIGFHSVKFDANSLSSGIYFYKIQAGNFIDIKKMSLIK